MINPPIIFKAISEIIPPMLCCKYTEKSSLKINS